MSYIYTTKLRISGTIQKLEKSIIIITYSSTGTKKKTQTTIIIITDISLKRQNIIENLFFRIKENIPIHSLMYLVYSWFLPWTRKYSLKWTMQNCRLFGSIYYFWPKRSDDKLQILHQHNKSLYYCIQKTRHFKCGFSLFLSSKVIIFPDFVSYCHTSLSGGTASVN